MKKLNKYLLS